MSVCIEFHGGAYYTVEGSYDEIVKLHTDTLKLTVTDLRWAANYEVVLTDGMFGSLGVAR